MELLKLLGNMLLATIFIASEDFMDDLDGAERRVEAASKKIGKFALNVGEKLVDIGVAGVKVGIAYESAFDGIRKTVDATEKQFEGLSNGIRAMAKEIPLSTTEIAQLAQEAGQLGIKTDNILEFTRVVADLGVTTNIVGQKGASQIAAFANLVGMSHDDFDRFGSSLVALGNNFETTENEILNMAMCLAGAGTQAGMSESEILGLATALSSAGIEAEMGGSALSQVMTSMQLAVEQGGQGLIDFAQAAGMSADEFASAYEENAAGALTAFIEGLATSEERGVSAIAVLNEMGITEAGLRDTLLATAEASDILADAVGLGGQAWEENIALTNEAEQRYATTAGQLEILKNKAKDVGISFFDMVQPFVVSTIEILSSGLDWLSQNLEMVLAVVVPLTTSLFTFAIAINLGGPNGIIAKAVKAIMGFNAVLAANPIGIVVALVAGLAAGIVYLCKTNETFRNAIGPIWEAIKNVVCKTIATIDNNLGGIIGKVTAVINKIKEFLGIEIKEATAQKQGRQDFERTQKEKIKLLDDLGRSNENLASRITASEESATSARKKGQEEQEEIVKKMIDAEQKYQDALDNRTKAIYNSYNLFENPGKDDPTPWLRDTTMGLRDQVYEMENWSQNLQKLTERGVEEGLLAELQAFGPKSNDKIKEILNMTEYQLNDYVGLWQRKHELARNQAITELQDMRQDTNNEISVLLAELKENSAVQYKAVGVDMILGIINGVNEKAEALKSTVRNLMEDAIKAAEDALEVKSPSKVFERIGKFVGKGFISGLQGMASAVNGAVGDVFSGLDTNVDYGINLRSNGLNAGGLPMAMPTQAAGTGGITGNTFNYYSPVPLTAIEQRRQTEQSMKALILGF